MKKLLKIFGILFLIFIGLLIAGVIAIKVMYPPKKVRAIVEKQLSDVAKRDIQVKNASLSLFPVFGVSVEGLKISNTSRHFTVQKDAMLWDILKRDNLDKRYVLVKRNGKDLEDVDKEDIKIAKGDKLAIARQDFKTDEPLFAINKLLVAVKVMPLLSRRIEIQKITLDKLQILVEVDKRGSFNFDDLIPKSDKKAKKAPKVEKKVAKKAPKESDSAKSEPLNIRLNAFEIINSKISYLNQKTGQFIVLDDINQKLSVSFDSAMKDILTEGLFEIKKISVSGRGLPVRKSGLYFKLKHKLHVNAKAGNMKLDELTVGFQKTNITTKGTVKGYDKPVRDLDLKITTNTLRLQDLFREVPPAMFPQARKMSVKGNAKLAVNVKGKHDSKKGTLPAINGLFKIMGGYFKYSDLPKAINKLNTDITFTMNSVNVKKFSLLLGADPVSMTAKVDNFKKPKIDVKLNANVNLGGLKDAVKLPKGMSLKGKIVADLKAKGVVDVKNYDAINVDGSVDMKDVVAVTSYVKKPTQVNGKLVFSNDKVELAKMTTKIGRSSFTTTLTVKDYLVQVLPKKHRNKSTVVTFTMDSPLMDLNEMLGIKSTSKSSKSGKTKKVAKASKSSSSSSTGNEPYSIPKLPNVEFVGKINIAKLQYSTIPIKKAKLTLTYKKGKMNMDMSAGWFDGKMVEKLAVDLTNPKRIKIKNTLNALKVEANDFISNFNDVPKPDGGFFDKLRSMDNVVYGKLNMYSNLTTSGITTNQFKKNLSGNIKTVLSRGRIKGATIFESMKSALPKIVQKFLPKMENLRSRGSTTLDMVVKQGKIHIDKLNIPTRKFALLGYGTIGLDAIMNMKMDIVLGRRISRKILRQQKRLMRAAKGALGKLGGNNPLLNQLKGHVGGALGKMKLIPSDKKGRVVPIIGNFGSISKMVHKFVGFKGGKVDTGDNGGGKGKSLGASAKAAAKAALNKAKAKAKAAIAAAKAKAMAEAKKAKAKAMAAANKAKAKAMAEAKKAKAKAMAEAKRAKAKARQQVAKKKKMLQKKAKDAKKKGLDALKKW
ncbi:MAG: hypothetical protein CL920_26050 [Deltaproteobacteria bacterium]|nr:hypothetical protein [Deltaproteobacteria bacterium]|tara:strand:- start:86 stop:3229 length:3144 start_codon:yes stop_codon:yes gene_type:complete